MFGNFRVSKAAGIISGLLVVLLLIMVTVYFYLTRRPVSETQVAAQNVPTQPSKEETPPQETTSTYEGLVDESLLKQPITKDPALIKDELEQLKDIQGQLEEQKDILNQQHQDADKLIELKQQQIADMEKRLQTQQ